MNKIFSYLYLLIYDSRLVRAIAAALLALVTLVITPSPSFAQPSQSVISFDSLAPGTILTDQFQNQGIRFVPYSERVTAVIETTDAGNIARFDHCEGGIECEFFRSGARGIFTELRQFLKVHVGLIPSSIPVQSQLTLTVYDPAGQAVNSSSMTVVAGTGFSTEIVVTSTTANIASFILEPIDDPANNARIALRDLTFDVNPNSPPDFILEGRSSVSVAAGGPSVEVPITIFRIGRSTGDISFNVTNLPDGVQATFSPNPVPQTNTTMRLSAQPDAPNSMRKVTVTATPIDSSAGTSPRSFNLFVSVVQALNISGPADIDLSGCNNADIATGSLAVSLTIIRDYRISGPVQLKISGLPPGVTAQFSPETVDFPGGAIGAKSTLTFTTNVDAQIPDTFVQLEASNGTITSTFVINVHGLCPRNNKDFVMRGYFLCDHLGTPTPIEGAKIDFYRAVSVLPDRWIGTTKTKADGSFEGRFWTNNENTYYAKIVLNDEEGVYLHNWWDTAIWNANSYNRGSNRDPIVDLGGTLITRDNGFSTPKCAIWQGAHSAYQEFKKTVGVSPPIGDYQIVMQNTVTGIIWTSLSTTNWEEPNYLNLNQTCQKCSPTGNKPLPITDPSYDSYFSLFDNYQANFHEFGHAIRHTVDGDRTHFTDDASRYTYARIHTICGSNPGYIEIEEQGFNEGWAEYWERYWNGYNKNIIKNICPSIDLTDTKIEGAVAYDLAKLSESLDTCLTLNDTLEKNERARRKAMFSVLQRGQNIIHKDSEFRREFALQFSRCTLPPLGLQSSNSNTALISTSHSALAKEGQNIPRPQPQPQLTTLQRLLDTQTKLTKQLKVDLKAAIKAAAKPGKCSTRVTCAAVAGKVVKPALIRGQIEQSELRQRTFAEELAATQRGERAKPDVSEQFEVEQNFRLAEFERQNREIVIKALQNSVAALAPLVTSDPTGELAGKSAELDRQIKLLQLKTPQNDDMFSLLKLAPSYPDDIAKEVHSSHVRMPIVIAVFLVFALITAAIWWFSRHRQSSMEP